MDLIFNNWEAIFAAIAVIGSLFGATFLKFKKYIDLVKEIGDVKVSYDEASEDGTWTDAEKIKFANQVLEAISASKALK